ncbi:tyrosine-type recombinase/integrase [Phenylobacterium sp.]|uniref:tyrosine-type recombinase/integrase n=1 Tax=Phenylobacterium sp. TaxID=1871053 RepID=UPI00374D570B
MARQVQRFTAIEIERLAKRPVEGLKYLHDGQGLYLAVDGRRAGPEARPTASWVFRYMMYGKARMLGLGSYPDVPLKDARVAAAEVRRLKANRQDPLAVKDAARAAREADAARAVTFRLVAADYLRANRTQWSNAKHSAQWETTLSTYVYPVIGDLIVGDIDTAAVLKVLRQGVADGKRSIPLWEARPETASRVRGRIETVLDYAKVKNLRTGDNPAAWRGNLKLALPARSKVRSVKHHAALAARDISGFLTALRAQQGTSARALEFAILTAARTGEVLGTTWREIDLAAGVWIIPADRMKAGREHRVPLSTQAKALLTNLQPEVADPAGLVFPGAKPGKPLSNMAFLMLLRRMKQDGVTAHGFRSTFRDWVSESTNFPTELAERALAHTVGDKTEAAYARGDLFEKRRALMDAWASFAGESTSNISELRPAAA